MPRETREQHQARRQQQAEHYQATMAARPVEATTHEVSSRFFLGGEGVYDAWPRTVADWRPPWVQ